MSRYDSAGQRDQPTVGRGSSASRLLHGLILASCFFAPLISAHNAESFFLHWTPTATAGAIIAFVLVTLLGAALLTATARLSVRPRAASELVLCAVPVAALFFTLLRFAPWKDALIESVADPRVRAAVVAVAIAVFAMALARPTWTLTVLRVSRLALVPITLVTLTTFARLAFGDLAVRANAVAPATVRGTAVPDGHVLILIFDELSFDQLYRDREIAPELPHLARFSGTARHHFAATAPGGETLESMSGHLALARFHDVDVKGQELLEVKSDGTRAPLRLGPGNLFARAQAAGYRTELFGTYLPYCDLLASVLDGCAAYSIYNTTSLSNTLSPLDAIRTSLILLPRQFPTGFLKNPPFAAYQRQLVDRIEAHASEPARDRPTFRFVHFSVPHSPFVFTESGYDPPFDPLKEDETRYRRQLVYVDMMIGRILTRLEAGPDGPKTTVVITSDHEWRSVTPRDRWSHVPLLVQRPAQQAREDDEQPVAVEQLLAGLADGRR